MMSFVSILKGQLEKIIVYLLRILKLQIPKDDHRCHYMRAKVRVHRYPSDELAIFHGPRKLADYDSKGKIK